MSVVLTLLLAGAALADKPVRTPAPPAEDATIEGACDFPVALEVLKDNVFETSFSDGRQRTSGAIRVRLTNVDSGTSLVANASGPAWVTETETTVEFFGQGSTVLFMFPTDEPASGVFLYQGNLHSVFDVASGSFTVASSTNPPRDLCADLA
jgi:hypothetical protein